MKDLTPLAKLLEKLPAQKASAHCDVPCGVYEPDSMTWAAETCLKIAGKLEGLEMPPMSDKVHILEYLNTVSRAVAVKEEYAEICKKEVLILWTDYFKPEHLDKWPDLSDKVWKITKHCSVVKRTVSSAEAQKLKDMVAELADIFRETKK
jgi:nickel superoxide dismutase